MAFTHAGRWGDDTVTNTSGRPLTAGTQVTVLNLDLTDADVYEDEDRTPAANPVTVGAAGNLGFYAEPGEYLLEANGVQIRVAVAPFPADLDGVGGGASSADEVAFTPAGTIAATDVQAAIEEVAAEAGGGGVSDGDKGDITVSSSGSVWTIDPGVVFAAMVAADVATQAELDAEAVLARNADNLASGTVADARVASTIARDSEVTSAISASEAGQVRDGDTAGGVLSGTYPDPGFAVDMATQAELDAKAPLASPALTGNPTAPTAAQGDNDTSIATTAFVNAEIAADAQPLSRTVNAQTDSYTLAAVDAGAVVTLSKATANVLTIPANATVAFPVGTVILARQLGVGGTTITGATGVIVNGVSAGSVPIGAQYGGATLVKLATDTWEIDGGASQYGGRLLGESRGTGAMVGITSTSAIDITPTSVEVTVTVGVKPIKVRIGCGSLDQSTAAKSTFIQFAHPVSGTVLATASVGTTRAGVSADSPVISDLTPGTSYVFKLQTKVSSASSGNINSFGGSPIAGCEPYIEVWEC